MHKTGKGRYRDMLGSNIFKSASIELLALRTIKDQDVEKLLYWKLKSI